MTITQNGMPFTVSTELQLVTLLVKLLRQELEAEITVRIRLTSSNR